MDTRQFSPGGADLVDFHEDGAAAEEYPGAAPLAIVVDRAATATAEPIALGLPFPRGLLRDGAALALSDPSGARVPIQVSALAHWPDGSVKWLLLDFLLGPGHAGRGVWSLGCPGGDPGSQGRPGRRIGLESHEQEIIIHTGPASFRLDRRALAPILRVEVDGRPILGGAPLRAVFAGAGGRALRLRVEACEFEAAGPVRATVRLDGSFVGRRRDRCRFRARVSFFAGTSLVRFDLTLHNPRRARHRGGLWDLGDPGSIAFRELSFRVGLGDTGPRRVRWTEEIDGAERTAESEAFEIYQESSGGENWRSRNHVNRHGRVPCRFRGYRVVRDGESSSGLRASPIVSVTAPSGTVTAALPEFWQQFPRAIDVRGQELGLGLFPGQFGDLFELQGGEQKTHTAWLHFGRGDGPGIDSLRWVHRPARAHAAPDWYARAEVIPCFSAERGGPGDRYESLLAAVVEGPRRLDARREVIDEYGWRNYGEIYADHEAAYYTGEPPVVSHYNNQYDVAYGLLIQYLRTGDARWLDIADPLARHVIDIDIYHTTEDRSAYNGGLFWHSDHYRDAATATHRAYSRANCGPNRRAYGGGPANEHNYTTGLLHYHYLTGDPRARDAVLSLANWVVARDDGRRTILGLVDDGPTGLASATTQPDYHGPGRGCGNSINALLDGWLLTGSRDYLEKAEALIRRAVHPAMDIAALDLLETELRWSYTVFLSALSRYLDVKAEAGEIDFMYAYARRCLLELAAWMVEHELPYFDRPETLEYPTETWAAQEFRKANVLRLAARHAAEPLRSRLIRRGDELADRAWGDLLRFESRDVARSVALVMVEGGRDSYWRRHPVGSAPAPVREYDFGSPQSFIPQKQRVLDRLRTPRGALDAVRGLTSIGNWRRYFSLRRGARA